MAVVSQSVVPQAVAAASERSAGTAGSAGEPECGAREMQETAAAVSSRIGSRLFFMQMDVYGGKFITNPEDPAPDGTNC